ncbi:MAG TPA: hypothetical protein VH349_07805 [Ktedonobacterales bacterium]|jgi:hypothetical protein
MRERELNGEHIWLRQSVTYTHEGQTRTLEIALPISPDASPEEIARLLAQAEAGMAQLTTSLDRRIAGEQVAPPRPTAPASPRQTEPARASEPSPVANMHEPSAPPTPEMEDEAPPPTQSSPRQTAPTPRPAPVPLEPEPVAAGPDLTRPEFIAAIGALGLNPKEAMDRLGVRSLAGLNLRESLETLRRQSLQGESSPVAPTASSAPAQSRGEALSVKPDRFDEEDDEALIFVEEGEDDEPPAPPRSATGSKRAAVDALDDDLDDVPDFGPPPGVRSRAAEPAVTEPPPSHAARIINKLRAAHPGGIATADRQSAFANIIVAELGEPNAAALVRGLWKLSPEKLGPEQLDALIRWGKGDTFSEEAEEVLATLRAEQRARTSGASSSSARGQAQSNTSRKRGES